jgi:NAD(P)-dependent dehydrogenase (short-subunit alcohol dehydrogenase family)
LFFKLFFRKPKSIMNMKTPPNSSPVVVVTGGARGVTSEVAVMLAETASFTASTRDCTASLARPTCSSTEKRARST